MDRKYSCYNLSHKKISVQGVDVEKVTYAFLQIDMLDSDGVLDNIEISVDGIKLSKKSPLYPSMFHKIAYRHTYPIQKKKTQNGQCIPA